MFITTEEAKYFVQKNLVEKPHVKSVSSYVMKDGKRWCAEMFSTDQKHASIGIDDGDGEKRYKTPQEAFDFLVSLGFNQQDIKLFITLSDPPKFTF